MSRLPHIRVFLPTFGEGHAVKRSRLVPRPQSAEIFGDLARSALCFTVLMNAVETVDPAARAVRDALRVPFRWRTDDVVLTYSAIGSGIGYHAGHEDAFIVQASGRRLWRVWDASETTADARRRLLLSDPRDIYPFVRPTSAPCLECELEPGDVLYIPPFWPHEGRTLDTSTSLALGWRGVCYYHLILAYPPLIQFSGPEPALDTCLFDLLPDFDHVAPQDGTIDAARATIDGLHGRDCRVLDAPELERRLVALFSSDAAAVAQNDAVAGVAS